MTQPTTAAGRLISEWFIAMRRKEYLGVPATPLVLDIEKQAAAKVRADLIERVNPEALIALFQEHGWTLHISDGEPLDPWQRVAYRLLGDALIALLRDDKEAGGE